MAKTTVRIELHSGNIRRFMRSAEVAGVLHGPAHRIKTAADAGIGGEPGHSAVVVQGHKDRVIALISATSEHARNAEAQRRNLTRSLDAGRG